MKLNIQQETAEPNPDSSREAVIFGVSDFQIDNSGSLTVFFPMNTGLTAGGAEFTVDGRITAGIEEDVLDDLTYSELLMESADKDAVIVVLSNAFPRLQHLVEDLPEAIKDNVTVIHPTDEHSELPL